jgi:hypothetical protein
MWINTPDFSEAIGPVPATLVQTANAEACSVDNRFDLTIPQVELRDSAGNKYTFSGVQRLHRLNGPPARTEGRWCGMLRIPVSPIEDKKAGRSAAA